MTSNGESGDSAVKVYVKEERLTVEEDMLHEFKGHRNFSKDDIPQAAIINKTQRPISRNLCGFLNTGAGGVVYCGVTDNGEVQGIHLTNYQKDHVLLSVQDLFSRFEPPVDSSMYTVHFVPVVTENDHVPDIPSFPVDPEQRNTPHILRTSKYCWCDKDASAQHDFGMISQLYVIEIEVFPWNPKSPLSVTSVTPIHPLFCNEEGLHFVRRLGGLHRPTLAEVIQLAEVDTARYHTMNKK
ncbi:uncharacterized protein LOC124338516 isoform X1 [Daphnia pulicaria]|uniref:uncharacterized protein LOC124338516 isoform X1 n=1 Tax=Daphnia pulicaria TaxID=35523 RepID=UPI001EECEDE4|nr:uncharacterized protein LOC124338516 isoform X1 [Daphnia pulicaria]